MSELPYMPEHVHDIMADTASLSNEELGAFMRLRWALWRAGGYLRKKEVAQASQAGEGWSRMADTIMARLTGKGRIVSNEALLEMLTRTRERRAKAVARAENAAAARWAKNPNENKANFMPQAFVKHANHNHNQNHFESKSLSEPVAAAGRRVELAQETAQYEKTIQLLKEHGNLRGVQARSQFYKWLAVFREPDDLFKIIAAADTENLRGTALLRVVDQRVQSAKRERERGLPLPFRPSAVKSGP